MELSDWVRVGIIASKEFDVPPDAEIIVTASDNRSHVVSKPVRDDFISVTYDTDVVTCKLWRYQTRTGGIWEIGLGYSEKCNTLVIWPTEVWTKVRAKAEKTARIRKLKGLRNHQGEHQR